MKGRAIIPLVVGLGIGIVAVKGFLTVLQKARGANSGTTVEVMRAATDIGPTVEITEAMVEKTSVPKSLAPDTAFLEKKDIVGRVTSTIVPKGMMLAEALLAPPGTSAGLMAKVSPGYRAVAIQIDEIAGVGGFLKPGAHVDVFLVMQTGNTRSTSSTISKVILQNVEVIAVGDKIQSEGQRAAEITRSVTVLVKPEDASRLHLASTKGKLRLAMRGQNDERERTPLMLTDKDLLSDGGPRRAYSGQQGESLLSRLFSKSSKPGQNQDDTNKPEPENTATAKPQKQDWVVEVIEGPEAYQVRFNSNKKDAQKTQEATLRAGECGPASLPDQPVSPSGSSSAGGKTDSDEELSADTDTTSDASEEEELDLFQSE